MSEKNYLTKEKLEALKNELLELKSVKRKEINDDLKYAKSLGDLSENAEYHEARDAQAVMESRIAYLENLVKNSEIVSAHHSDVVEVGSTVVVEKNGGDKRTLDIVGSEEADMATGKISNVSPLGEALMGKVEGDSFEFETPSGKVKYTIIDIK
jgi:transcription elongation factor GreA